MMSIVDKLADIFAGRSYELNGVYHLIIQPKSVLRKWRTSHHGFLFVIRGQAKMKVNGTHYALHPGTVLHASPGLELNAQLLGESELEYFSLFYTLDHPEMLMSIDEASEHFLLEPGPSPSVPELLTMLHRNIRMSETSIAKLRAKELFLSLMHQTLANCQYRASGSSPDKKTIEQALAYINEYYMNPLTLDELANLYAMPPQRFSYYFRKYTGWGPIDYVIHYRMERAKELLKNGTFLVRDVAASVGYANPLYFSRVFKKKFGVSPSEYIRQLEP